MFGAILYVPMYLQIVKGHSATASGLLLLPLMGGVIVSSVISGRVDLQDRPVQVVHGGRRGHR